MDARTDDARHVEGTVAKVTRRRFLGGAGSAVLGAGMAAAGCADGGTRALPVERAQSEAARAEAARSFGRMFPRLQSFDVAMSANSQGLHEALVDMGRPGGILDAADDLAAGPVELITNADLSLNNPNNPSQTAGTTFFGQYVDHDLTFDATSDLGVATDPRRTTNGRTPVLDLDSLYGGGPVASPQLYERDRLRLRISSGGQFEDLPRDADGRAVIADPRNDENLIISGVQAAFILFHNAVLERERARGRGRSRRELFAAARRSVTWHYQWIVVHEYLPQICGQAAVDAALRERRHFRPQRAMMPVEFQGAAYRFGHSMVRPSYRANMAGDNGEPFFGLIFQSGDTDEDDPADLRGGARAPRRFVGWQTFFDFGDGEVKPNKLIDTKLSTPLFDLPLGAIASGEPPTSLATRNLLRHITWSQPSGQQIAEATGAAPLAPGDLGELSGYGVGLETSTPLWYYILKEAEVIADGLTLGPIGACIVAECIIGVLQLDQRSYLQRPRWRPDLPTRSGRATGDFTMADLLTFAAVDPASRGQ